ncbi:MAG TPA: hypothetical protein VHA56_12015 [Mucilaginibacter sp.]|nr:hypothetical protein [Mucilaginibacter sp.]
MKPLDKLTNVEKGKLLHELFPDEIPAFLQFTTGICIAIREQEQSYRAHWDNGIYSFDFWLSLVKEAQQKIEKYGSQLQRSSRLFAEQLFDGYIALYLVHCLLSYTTIRKHPNPKFTTAIDLLFNI